MEIYPIKFTVHFTLIFPLLDTLFYLIFLNLSTLNAVIVAEVRAGCSLAWPVRFQIIEGIAHGAVYLHQHSRVRVVHRDLKPTNILLDHDMTPVITDFGIAEVLNSDEDEKETDAVVGTW